MGIGQGVGTSAGTGASPVSYRHNFLVFILFSDFMSRIAVIWIFSPESSYVFHTLCHAYMCC